MSQGQAQEFGKIVSPGAPCDCAHGRRNSFPAIELCQLAGGEDTRCDQQHTLPALVHAKQFIIFAFCSPRVVW